MDIREIHQTILDAAIGLCENREASLRNIEGTMIICNTKKILRKNANAIKRAVKIIKDMVYDSC